MLGPVTEWSPDGGANLGSPGVKINVASKSEKRFLHSARGSLAKICALTGTDPHLKPSSPPNT